MTERKAKPSTHGRVEQGFGLCLRNCWYYLFLSRFIGSHCMIRSFKGMRPTIPASCYVDDSAQIIGDVVLGENASVWMNTVLRGDVYAIRVGAYSNIQDCSVLHGMKNT